MKSNGQQQVQNETPAATPAPASADTALVDALLLLLPSLMTGTKPGDVTRDNALELVRGLGVFARAEQQRANRVAAYCDTLHGFIVKGGV